MPLTHALTQALTPTLTLGRPTWFSCSTPSTVWPQVSAGGYFGERALLLGEPRGAHVIATRKTVCLEVSKDIFDRDLGPLQAMIDKDRKQREHIAARRQEMLQQRGLQGASINDFTISAMVLEHDFGQYLVAKHDATGKQYTFKAIEKTAAVKLNMTTRVMHEHKVVHRLVEDFKFVPSVLMTLETEAYLLSICSTTSVTDLHQCMADYGPFDEATALFYAANVFLGIEYLHQNGYAYRNVSPEAITLDSSGYVTLTDLRFAAEKDNKVFDLCGNYAYLAPEQVSSSGHDHAVDYWALGILIYDMMTERTPWTTGDPALDTEEALFSKIASHYTGALQYPDAFSLELVAILDKLLEPLVAQRITTPQEFRSNGWLQVVDWEMLMGGKVAAPHGPECEKLLSEHRAKGISKCLPTTTYKGGSKKWYEGYAPNQAASSMTPGSERPSRGDPSDSFGDTEGSSPTAWRSKGSKKKEKKSKKEIAL